MKILFNVILYCGYLSYVIECRQRATILPQITSGMPITSPDSNTGARITSPQWETTETKAPDRTTTYQIETTQTYHPQTSQRLQPETVTTKRKELSTFSTFETTTVFQPKTSVTTESETTTGTTIKTTIPTTQTQPAVPKFVLKDSDTVCIVLQAKINFDIRYMKKDQTNGTAHIELPFDAAVAGSCNYENTKTTQQMRLVFFTPPWELDIVIAKDESYGSLLSADSSYGWQEVGLSYNVDKHFPDANFTGLKILSKTSEATGTFKAYTDGSYRCQAKQVLTLGSDESVKVHITNMQYRAFGNTESTDFPKTGVLECEADKRSNKTGSSHKTLGLALGCAIAGLIVVTVFTATVWCRRKKHAGDFSDYSTIN